MKVLSYQTGFESLSDKGSSKMDIKLEVVFGKNVCLPQGVFVWLTVFCQLVIYVVYRVHVYDKISCLTFNRYLVIKLIYTCNDALNYVFIDQRC